MSMRSAVYVVLIAWSIPSASWAGVIIQPVSASTNMGTQFGSSVNNVINQSGLSTGYTSLVTDFDAYIAGSPTAAHGAGSTWQSSFGVPTGNFDFDLGANYVIGSFALWNIFPGATSAVRDFSLLASADPSSTTTTNLGSFTANQLGTVPNTGVQVFAFSPTSARYVRMQITSNYGSDLTQFNEAAFEQSQLAAVPEPSSLAVLSIGGALGLARLLGRRTRTG